MDRGSDVIAIDKSSREKKVVALESMNGRNLSRPG
jgi:hypothetical protein